MKSSQNTMYELVEPKGGPRGGGGRARSKTASSGGAPGTHSRNKTHQTKIAKPTRKTEPV